MEKGRLYVLRGTAPEEPVASNGHLAAFNNLEVGGVARERSGTGVVTCARAARCGCAIQGGASRQLCTTLCAMKCCRLLDPQVRSIFLDDVMARPDAPELACIADYETRSLRWVGQRLRALFVGRASAKLLSC